MNRAQALFAGVLLILGFLTLVPLITVIYGALTTTRPGRPFEGLTVEVLTRAYSSESFWAAGLNTLIYAIGVTVVAVGAGAFLAWVVERTNAPFRNAIFVLSVVRLIVPGLLVTMAWILILGPNAGILNVWLSSLLGLDEPPINIFSMPGMIFVEGLQTVPIPFLLMVAAFRSMDPALEEASRASGAGIVATARRVSLPLVRPAIYAAALIAFVSAFEGFETPALIGLRATEPVRTFSTEIWTSVSAVPRDFNLASAYSIIFLSTAMFLMYLYLRATRKSEQYATVTGKGFRPNVVDLGPWRWPTTIVATALVALMFVVPVAALAWRSVQPYNNAPSPESLDLLTTQNWELAMAYDLMWSGLVNSLILGLVVAGIVMVLCAIAAWLVIRSRVRGRGLVDAALFIPISMPGLVIGLAFFWFALTAVPLVYGTLVIIGIAHATKLLPYGMRFASTSMIQVHADLEAAAYVSGATTIQAFRRIIFPLLLPGLLAGFIFVFIGSVRELSSSIILAGFDTRTYPVILFDRWADEPGMATAMALVGVTILGTVVLAARIVGSRLGVRA